MPFKFSCRTCGTESDVFDGDHHGHVVDVSFMDQKEAQAVKVTEFDDQQLPDGRHQHSAYGKHKHGGGTEPHSHDTYQGWKDAQ